MQRTNLTQHFHFHSFFRVFFTCLGIIFKTKFFICVNRRRRVDWERKILKYFFHAFILDLHTYTKVMAYRITSKHYTLLIRAHTRTHIGITMNLICRMKNMNSCNHINILNQIQWRLQWAINFSGRIEECIEFFYCLINCVNSNYLNNEWFLMNFSSRCPCSVRCLISE